MNLPPFELERFLADREFSSPHPLCSSDCESMALKDLLEMEPGARAKFDALWLGYTESAGHPELRQAIAGLYTKVSAADVLVHAGAEEAIFTFMNSALRQGDHLIVQWPCYQSLFQIAETIGCEVTRWEADPDRSWELEVDFLTRNLRSNTKAVVLNLPHNPTGYLMSAEKLAAVVEILRRHGCLLFLDEVYRGLEYDFATTLPAGCDLYENAVSLGVMSKSFGLAGLRIGWVATRNRALLSAMAHFKDYTSICSSAPSEFLSQIALRQRVPIVARNREIIRANFQLLCDFFQRHAATFSWVPPRAGCIAFPALRAGACDAFCERLLSEAGVLLAPGSRFGFDSRHFRVGFGRATFRQGLEQLESALGS